MTTKIPLLFTIIALLPFGVWADYTYNYVTTPAQVVPNGTVTRASALGPYTIATIEDDDAEHIASTAYVKGAYNDAIAAINKQERSVSGSLSSLGNDMDNLRVNVYTTWDDDSDNAVTPVEVFVAE